MTTRYQFRYGDAVPSDDAVARWITVLAIAYNDILLAARHCIDSDCSEAESAYFFRLAAGHLIELVNDEGLLGAGVDQWPEVQEFVASLPPEVQDDMERLRVLRDSSSKLGKKLTKLRSKIFHYPHLHKSATAKGRGEVDRALDQKKDDTGQIEQGRTVSEGRYLFADDVLLEILSPTFGDLDDFMKEVREIMLAFLRLAAAALDEYFGVTRAAHLQQVDGAVDA